MMKILCLFLLFFLFLFLLLVIPVRYRLALEDGRLTFTLTGLFGLLRKKRVWPRGEEEIEEIEEKQEIKEIEEPPVWENGATGKENERPGIEDQIAYLYETGTWKDIARWMSDLWRHSRPRKGHLEGRFGTGEADETGMLAGWCAVFLPCLTRDIIWIYTHKVNELRGDIEGRILPLYGLLRTITLLCRPSIRQFLRYRKGKEDDRRT